MGKRTGFPHSKKGGTGVGDKKVRVGVIGLGGRGSSMLATIILNLKCAVVTAVCDLYEDRAQHAGKIVRLRSGVRPAVETDYKKVVDSENVDAVVIMTSWEPHVEIAAYSMLRGKAVAMEVGGAYSVQDCWRLVDTYEQTKTPFMFLENCCFGRREMMVLNMKRLGVLGEIVHCSGSYGHDLREEIAFGRENRHYRLRNYISRNCENYPTHDLGPIAKVLDVNRGNRLVSLTSTASKAAGLATYIAYKKPNDKELLNTTFKQGDIVTTVLRCANGETVTLMLDTTLPRYYTRSFTVRGTKGMYEESTDSVFLDRKTDKLREFAWRKLQSGNAKKYAKKYDHEVWKRYLREGVSGSHEGMDLLEFKIFFDCLLRHKPMPVDVYDAATWMAVTPLSEQSIANGSASVEFPDFTRGRWKNGGQDEDKT